MSVSARGDRPGHEARRDASRLACDGLFDGACLCEAGPGDPHIVATDFFPVVDHPTEGRIRNMRPSARFSETPVETKRLAPRLSEHSAEILREAGFSADEIAALVRDGVTKTASNT